jgi:hypothetical protein
MYWDLPCRQRNPQASPARARTRETDTVQGVPPHDCLTKDAPLVSLQRGIEIRRLASIGELRGGNQGEALRQAKRFRLP